MPAGHEDARRLSGRPDSTVRGHQLGHETRSLLFREVRVRQAPEPVAHHEIASVQRARIVPIPAHCARQRPFASLVTYEFLGMDAVAAKARDAQDVAVQQWS